VLVIDTVDEDSPPIRLASAGMVGASSSSAGEPVVTRMARPKVASVKLKLKPEHDYKWHERKKLLTKALSLDKAGVYSDSDRHLLNVFLVGDCACFYQRPIAKEGGLQFEEIWKAVSDQVTLAVMEDSPAWTYATKLLDAMEPMRGTEVDWKWQHIADPLLESSLIQHSVMIVVDTSGRVLSRGRKGGEFCKVGCGGGASSKNLIHNHFAARNGPYDEFGIGFHNPAVLDISPPFLDILPPGKTEKSEGRQYGIVWVQYMLIDATQVVKLDEPPWLNDLSEPATDGDWGHWEVGGERLRCKEN